ncbi:MAG: hypothetical protein Q8M88_01810 [Phenylobacterium sp.]|nr:hypothetical protein [Phenylobacterium sp.]MDP3173153.1 hypothetical protein [Phenylobacterium sp.]
MKALLFAVTLVAIIIGLALPTPHADKPEGKSQIELVELGEG